MDINELFSIVDQLRASGHGNMKVFVGEPTNYVLKPATQAVTFPVVNQEDNTTILALTVM